MMFSFKKGKRSIIKSKTETPQKKVQYSLEYILSFFNGEGEMKFPLYYSANQLKYILEGRDIGKPEGKITVRHDISLKKWRLTVQLEPDRWWFLTVFFHETGEFDMFSLDFEAADDSHYEFVDEDRVRSAIYASGDENLYLHEVFIRFIRENGKGDGQQGGFRLRESIPITKTFHYY